MGRASTRTFAVSGTAILAKLYRCGGHISRTPKVLGVRKTRVVEVKRNYGNPAKDNKERTEIEAAEDLVFQLSAIIQTLRVGDGRMVAELGRAFGKSVERLVVLVDRAEARRRQKSTITVLDLLSFPRADLLELNRKHNEKSIVHPATAGE